MPEEQKKTQTAWDMMTQTPGVKQPLAYTAPMTLPNFQAMSQQGGKMTVPAKPAKGK